MKEDPSMSLYDTHHSLHQRTMTSLVSAVLPLVALICLTHPAVAQNSGQTLTSHDIYLSHLSPMITYSPLSPRDTEIESGWNVSLQSHSATHNGASIEFGYFGRTMEVWGNGTNYDWVMTNMGAPDSLYAAFQEIGEPATLRLLSGFDLDWHDVRLRVNESEPSYMDIRGFMLRTYLPQLE